MERKCNMCGYRINPDTALRAGVVSQKEYRDNFMINPVMSWCENMRGWISDQSSCADWLPYTEYDGESKYRRLGGAGS